MTVRRAVSTAIALLLSVALLVSDVLARHRLSPQAGRPLLDRRGDNDSKSCDTNTMTQVQLCLDNVENDEAALAGGPCTSGNWTCICTKHQGLADCTKPCPQMLEGSASDFAASNCNGQHDGVKMQYYSGNINYTWSNPKDDKGHGYTPVPAAAGSKNNTEAAAPTADKNNEGDAASDADDGKNGDTAGDANGGKNGAPPSTNASTAASSTAAGGPAPIPGVPVNISTTARPPSGNPASRAGPADAGTWTLLAATAAAGILSIRSHSLLDL